MSIFVQNLEGIRQSQKLDHRMPETAPTFAELDGICEELAASGRLQIVEGGELRQKMGMIKDQSLDTRAFRDLANPLLEQLAIRARPTHGEVKAAISVRAGAAFLPHILSVMPHAEIGFMTQARDEETAECTSVGGKLGSFAGKRAIAFDPMIATGGSMVDMVNAVMDLGATDVTVVGAFATPQGIERVSRLEAVTRIVTPPLEAGLNPSAFIVGGIGERAMLGDFGDRFFGPVKEPSLEELMAARGAASNVVG